jgi:hypothetical protein
MQMLFYCFLIENRHCRIECADFMTHGAGHTRSIASGTDQQRVSLERRVAAYRLCKRAKENGADIFT